MTTGKTCFSLLSVSFTVNSSSGGIKKSEKKKKTFYTGSF